MENDNSIRVSFVDCPKIYKEGLRSILKRCPTMKIVGEARIDKRLLKFIILKKPDILLIDVDVADAIKLKSIAEVIRYHPQVKVIALFSCSTENTLEELLNIGVHGFVQKDSDDNVVQAIKRVYQGKKFYSAALISKIELAFSQRKISREKEETLPSFNKIEEQIIESICHEMTNNEIADKLVMSVRTIEGYRTRILQKMKTKGTAGIVIYAIEHGLFESENTAPV